MWRRRGGVGGVALACLTLSITWKFCTEKSATIFDCVDPDLVLKHVGLHLLVDGGTDLNHQETVGDHRKNTQDRGEEDRQPNDGLAQGISGGSWKHTDAVSKWFTVIANYGLEILQLRNNCLCGALLVFERSPIKANARGNRRNRPLLYIVNVTTKYMARLPNTNRVFTAVQ